MTALIVVLMLIGFVLVDIVVRTTTRRLDERRRRRAREAALVTSLHLDFTHEAPSLKRAEVAGPKARILAVDDEPAVLDALREILVLDGFSVDTVESGPEALGLVQRRDYDFVFTDLKMAGMDGVELVTGIKHLRPDTDVAVLTGYATSESAAETMRDGAVDYVQKPFTAGELTAFARRLHYKRQARLEAQRLPQVHIVSPGFSPAATADEFNVPGGAFLSDGHTWARIEPTGQVRVGLDDFARRAMGSVERLGLPRAGAIVQCGQPLFAVHRGGTAIHFAAPISGTVAEVNEQLRPHRLLESPYEGGWVCLIEPENLAAELAALRIGKPVVDWYQAEVVRLRRVGGPAVAGIPQLDWHTLQEEFFTGRPAA
jgi:CheY-like chemotaxis protein